MALLLSSSPVDHRSRLMDVDVGVMFAGFTFKKILPAGSFVVIGNYRRMMEHLLGLANRTFRALFKPTT
jgi:hypothetical protein